MKTKLFFSFLTIIIIALVSNVIFNYMIQRDFDDYVRGSREDHLYWVLAAVEGSYDEGAWDREKLVEALHWGMMLGFDVYVSDSKGRRVIKSVDVLDGLEETMRKRMESMIDLSEPQSEFDSYPLFVHGEEIGTMGIRTAKRLGNLAEKEKVYQQTGMEFLYISFLIAGGGALFLSMVFSIFLTKPIKKLKEAADTIAKGDFDVKVDVTSKDEIGKLAQSFNFMSDALKREDDIRKHLTSNIAHELRTPLTIMKANFEGIADGVIACSHEQVHSLREEVERLIALVEGIEDVTRAETSFLREGATEEFDLRDIIEHNVMSVRNMKGEKDVELSFNRELSLVVTADKEKLNRIIKNLLTNALKFTERGSISVDHGSENGRFFVAVSDTGRGMGDDEMKNIFNRYYKGTESQGTGIGLSIAKELVETLGGGIDVRSKSGEGSTFTVHIPMKGEK